MNDRDDEMLTKRRSHSGDWSDECSNSTCRHASAQCTVARQDGRGRPDDGHTKGEACSGVAGNSKRVAAWATGEYNKIIR